MSDAAAYIAKWARWKVLWTDLYVGARIRRCSATADIGNNQIKNIEYEQLPMRLGRFIVDDAAVHGGVVARFEREQHKPTAAVGRSLAAAARDSAASAATASATADGHGDGGGAYEACASATAVATAAPTAEGEGSGAALDGRSVAAAAHASAVSAATTAIADGEGNSEGEGSSDDAKRAADARPDHWQRGGVPLTTQNAIAEVYAAKAARRPTR